MSFKINIQSRLKRHSRNLMHTRKGFFKRLTPVKVLTLIALILPIYPSFGMTDGLQQDANREIDASTILSAYYDQSDIDPSFFSQDTGFVRPGVITNDSRDVQGNNLVHYSVQSGDSLGFIADRFQVSSDSILWANDLSRDTVLKPGMSLKIPPVSGLVYTVLKGDSIDLISEKFKVDSVDIFAQNQLLVDSDIQPGQTLIIPGAQKIVPKPVIGDDKKMLVKNGKDAKIIAKNKLAKKALDKKAPKSSLSVFKRSGKNTFASGYCTWFVANHKNVTWRGNANQWLNNARAAGVATGSTPVSGAIIQF